MDKACLECWINAPKKDSIIDTQQNFIESQEATILEYAEELEDEKSKKKRAWIIGASAGTIFGALLIGLIK